MADRTAATGVGRNNGRAIVAVATRFATSLSARAQVDSGRQAFNNPAMVSYPLNLVRAGRGALFATRLCEDDGGHER